MNTPLFKKYFEGGIDLFAGPGIRDAENIIVKGKALIDEYEFIVTYDLANAAIAGRSIFIIPFFLENISNGVSHRDALLWSTQDEESGILLSFDDDHWHTWRQYFDMFDRYGARATFFIQGTLHSRARDDILAFSSEAVRRGHDLGFHTVNHLDLRTLTREEFNAETIEAAAAFSRAGINFSAFAFPFGFSQPWMRTALAPFFLFTRGYGVNIRFYDGATITRPFIVSTALDNIVFPDDEKFESDMRLILFAAKFTGNTIVPLTTHNISDTAQWGIKPERLEFLLRTAQELRLRFYTYSDVRTYFR